MKSLYSKLRIPALLVLALICSQQVAAQTYEIDWCTIDNGGGFCAAGAYELNGTIGQHDSGSEMTGGGFSMTGGFWSGAIDEIVLGDVNGDGVVNLLDVAPFVEAVANGTYIPEADVNQDGVVNLLDVNPFILLLSGG